MQEYAHGNTDTSAVSCGQLASSAARILMKVLYAARLCRYDLLRPVSFLAQRVTKWTHFCDKLLHKTMCWINSSLDLSLWGWCGDKDMGSFVLSLFCDSDFAGCSQTARSTTGVFLALVGPHTFLPLAGISKRQTAVSHSTPEEELVAADHGVRVEGLPAVTLWNVLLKRDVSLVLCEDNESAACVIETARNPTMRHILRTHRVDLAFFTKGSRGATY